MYLTTGGDFRKSEDRENATKCLREHKPMLLTGSPMGAMFSRLQNLSPWNEQKENIWNEAVEHIVCSAIVSDTNE